MKIIHIINSEDVDQQEGDEEEDDEHDQHWMTQHTVYASTKTLLIHCSGLF
jgi:hypothetical protein